MLWLHVSYKNLQMACRLVDAQHDYNTLNYISIPIVTGLLLLFCYRYVFIFNHYCVLKQEGWDCKLN